MFAASKLPEGTLQAAAAYVDEWPAVSVALGTSTSGVHIYKGDATKGKLTPAPFGCRVLRFGGGGNGSGSGGAGTSHKSDSHPSNGVTAVHFAGSGNSLHLFALTAGSLAAISLATGQFLVQDECGAGPGGSALTSGGELLVAGTDAVHYYTAEEGRKAAVAIKGSKHAVVAFRHYIAAAVPDDASATSDNGASSNSTDSSNTVLRIFDAANKLVAATAPVNPPLKWIVAGSRGILAADNSGAAIRLWEKPLEQRLESLFRSRSFQLALRIAHMENASVKTIAEVKKYFGDFLYSKRDYDAAAVQYAGTVGVLEPSYVIQKFLDAQRVHNLTTYLEAVHDKVRKKERKKERKKKFLCLVPALELICCFFPSLSFFYRVLPLRITRRYFLIATQSFVMFPKSINLSSKQTRFHLQARGVVAGPEAALCRMTPLPPLPCFIPLATTNTLSL